jgi:hypothetical protein
MKLLRSFATYSHRRGSYLFVLGLAKLLVVSPVLREQFRAGLQAAEHSYFLVAGGDVAKMRNQSITFVPYMTLQ